MRIHVHPFSGVLCWVLALIETTFSNCKGLTSPLAPDGPVGADYLAAIDRFCAFGRRSNEPQLVVVVAG